MGPWSKRIILEEETPAGSQALFLPSLFLFLFLSTFLHFFSFFSTFLPSYLPSFLPFFFPPSALPFLPSLSLLPSLPPCLPPTLSSSGEHKLRKGHMNTRKKVAICKPTEKASETNHASILVMDFPASRMVR